MAEQRYYPYGEERWASGPLPTDRRFTGQRWEQGLGLYDYNARWYHPYISRFVSPDTTVPQRGDPQSLNRYSYVRDNPVLYCDESGHCWGIASGIRGIPSYGTTCSNIDMALTIAQHPEASAGQKAGAIAYVATEGTAHLALAVGGGILAWEGASAVAAAVGGTKAAATATTAATAACADGDCGNEVNTAARTARNVWELNPLRRGVEIENMLGRSPQLSQNFPVIDRFKNGVATSIRSMDLGAASYQNISTLTSKVRGYVNTLANWQGARWGGFEVKAGDIVVREVLLAIPPGATETQMAALQQLQQWAATVGVSLNTAVVP